MCTMHIYAYTYVCVNIPAASADRSSVSCPNTCFTVTHPDQKVFLTRAQTAFVSAY